MDKFDNIVFKNKNKEYGAYVLRKRYYWNVCIGLVLSIIIIVSVSIFAFVKGLSNSNDAADYELQQEIAEYEQYNLLKDIDSLFVIKPPAKEKIKKKEDKTLVVVDSLKPEFDTIKVVKFNDESDTLQSDSLASDTSQSGSPNGAGDGELYIKVEAMAMPPCGYEGVKKFQKQNTQYPEEAKTKKIQGDVTIQFYVKKDGSIEKVLVAKKANSLLDDEALRVSNLLVKIYPIWKPAIRNNQPVKSCTWLKFVFRLY